MSYSVTASNWWANRLTETSREDKRRFARKLKEKVELLIGKYGHCIISTETGKPCGMIHDALMECNIPIWKSPFNVRMEVYPDKITVCHNGGRKETVYPKA